MQVCPIGQSAVVVQLVGWMHVPLKTSHSSGEVQSASFRQPGETRHWPAVHSRPFGQSESVMHWPGPGWHTPILQTSPGAQSILVMHCIMLGSQMPFAEQLKPIGQSPSDIHIGKPGWQVPFEQTSPAEQSPSVRQLPLVTHR